MERTVASAPGKVLVTGGYLVLEQPNAGLVLSVGARFYAVVEPLRPPVEGGAAVRVQVHSPQFERRDAFDFDGVRLVPAPPSSPGPRNRFIEYPISHCLALARSSLGEARFRERCAGGLAVTLLGGNDFYSHRLEVERRGLPLSSESLASLPPFLPPDRAPDGGIVKTGLGSSAALVTALVGALLQHLGLADLPSPEGPPAGRPDAHEVALRLVHNVAQLAHCRAQGKIGSGFDVSAAVYGSQRYVRFSPPSSTASSPAPCAPPAPAGPARRCAPGRAGRQAEDEDAVPAPEALEACLRREWDGAREGLRLPPGLALVVGEVHGGSNTPALVSAVLRWRAARSPDVERVWGGLAAANARVEAALRALEREARERPEGYAAELARCGAAVRGAWGGAGRVGALLGRRGRRSRQHGLAAGAGGRGGVPVEPPEQTARADAAMALPGVLAAGVPGAGGHDALFGIAVEGPARAALEAAWLGASVCPLPCPDAAGAGLLRLPPAALPIDLPGPDAPC
eukprot:tig00001181_g7441.t1